MTNKLSKNDKETDTSELDKNSVADVRDNIRHLKLGDPSELSSSLSTKVLGILIVVLIIFLLLLFFIIS